MTCWAIQKSDQMVCSCGNTWDMNDPDPPACRLMPSDLFAAEKIIQLATTGTNEYTQCIIVLTNLGRVFNLTKYHGQSDFTWTEIPLPPDFCSIGCLELARMVADGNFSQRDCINKARQLLERYDAKN